MDQLCFCQLWPQGMSRRGVTISNLWKRKKKVFQLNVRIKLSSTRRAICTSGVTSSLQRKTTPLFTKHLTKHEKKTIHFPAGFCLLHHYWAVDCSKLQCAPIKKSTHEVMGMETAGTLYVHKKSQYIGLLYVLWKWLWTLFMVPNSSLSIVEQVWYLNLIPELFVQCSAVPVKAWRL